MYSLAYKTAHISSFISETVLPLGIHQKLPSQLISVFFFNEVDFTDTTSTYPAHFPMVLPWPLFDIVLIQRVHISQGIHNRKWHLSERCCQQKNREIGRSSDGVIYMTMSRESQSHLFNSGDDCIYIR